MGHKNESHILYEENEQAYIETHKVPTDQGKKLQTGTTGSQLVQTAAVIKLFEGLYIYVISHHGARAVLFILLTSHFSSITKLDTVYLGPGLQRDFPTKH